MFHGKTRKARNHLKANGIQQKSAKIALHC
jgi:hypothetical protein